MATFPPSAANTNPMRILYVTSPAARARLVNHVSDGNTAKTASAPAVAILAADGSFHHLIPQLFPSRPGLRDYFAVDDQARERHAQFNAILRCGYFLLAVRAAGLAAGPMTGFDAAGVDAESFPDGRLHALMVVNIGKPGPNPWLDRLPRPDYEQVVRFI